MIAIIFKTSFRRHTYDNVKMSEWRNDCCLTPRDHSFSHIKARTNSISTRWWWCLLCIRLTLLDFNSVTCSSQKQIPGWTCRSNQTYYPNSEPTKSLLLLLYAVSLAEKQQIPLLLSLAWPDKAFESKIYRTMLWAIKSVSTMSMEP